MWKNHFVVEVFLAHVGPSFRCLQSYCTAVFHLASVKTSTWRCGFFSGRSTWTNQQLEGIIYNIYTVWNVMRLGVISFSEVGGASCSVHFTRPCFLPDIDQNNSWKWLDSDLQMCLHQQQWSLLVQELQPASLTSSLSPWTQPKCGCRYTSLLRTLKLTSHQHIKNSGTTCKHCKATIDLSNNK